MTTYVTPKKNTAYKFYVGLIDQSNTKLLKANPTIASGDFKVSTDGGAFANLTTLPSANPASGRAVMIDLSSTEMNGDNIYVQCVDAAGAEWCDLAVNIQTSARQIDDLAFPATTGRSMVVDAAGLVDSNMVKNGPSGSGTAVPAGGIPNAVAGASGGLMISGTNVGTVTLAALTVSGATTLTGAVTASHASNDIRGVTTTSNIKKNQALNGFQFLMTDSTNHNPASGKTITATRSLNGAAFASCTSSATEVSTAIGTYTIDLSAADLNANTVMLRFTATGCDDTFVEILTVP